MPRPAEMGSTPAHRSELRARLDDLERLASAQEGALTSGDFVLLEGLQDAAELILADLRALPAGPSPRNPWIRHRGETIHARFRILAERMSASREGVAVALEQIRATEQYDRFARRGPPRSDLVDFTG